MPIFTLARDGERDAVFNVYESLFSHDVDGQRITVSLLGKPEVTASGKVREITPTSCARRCVGTSCSGWSRWMGRRDAWVERSARFEPPCCFGAAARMKV